MEKHTKIPASSPGGFSGKMYFTKGDLRKWHQWYKERTGKFQFCSIWPPLAQDSAFTQ
jgi:hypothetical protein